MIISLMKKEDAKAIYTFELENKDYFESVLPPRPMGYFQYEDFQIIMDNLLNEQNKGLSFMHVIRNDQGILIGRINLHRDENGSPSKMELGYRIAKAYQGQGIASQAVKELIKMAKENYGLKEIEAGTSTKNIGSRRVLEKNGFKLIGEEKNVMKVNGEWVDGALYSIHLFND